jgi:hypothetical protein
LGARKRKRKRWKRKRKRKRKMMNKMKRWWARSVAGDEGDGSTMRVADEEPTWSTKRTAKGKMSHTMTMYRICAQTWKR